MAGGLAIEDDGPGMSDEAIARAARGQLWNESKPGARFGLAIVADIAEEAGASLRLGRSGVGGRRVDLDWTRPMGEAKAAR